MGLLEIFLQVKGGYFPGACSEMDDCCERMGARQPGSCCATSDRFFMANRLLALVGDKGPFTVELPMAALAGWYKHPLTLPPSPPLLPPGLLPGVHHLQLHTRILFLDGLMIALVALHWWLVAQVLRRKEQFARWVWRPILVITIAGVVSALACLPPHGWHFPELIVMLSVLAALIGWLWAIGASAVSVAWSAYQWGYRRVHA